MNKRTFLIVALLITALTLLGCGGLEAEVNEMAQFEQPLTPGEGATETEMPGETTTPTAETGVAGETPGETGTPATATETAEATGTPGAQRTPMTATPEEGEIPSVIAEAEEEWPMANKDYRNTRAALDAEITSQNVEELGIAWTFPITGTGPYGAAASNPLIVDGTVYFQDLASNVYALDLQTGELLWERIYDEPVVGPNGPALGYDKVFVHGGVNTLRALDRETGEELWETELDGPTGAQQPYVFDGYVYTGTAAGEAMDEQEGVAIRGYAPGTSGRAYAVDQETGEIVWEFQVVEEGFWGNPEVNSGGGVWFPPAIDTETGLTYWGTGNPAPFPGTTEWPNGSSRPGPNLYTNSLLALNHRTGELVWYNQVKPHDLFDHDFHLSPLLTDAQVEGQERALVIGAGKLGRVLAFDRESGEIVWDTSVGEHENDELERIPPGEIVEVLPGVYGGVETPMALADGVVYVPVLNLPTPYTATGFGAEDGTEAVQNAEGRTNIAEATGVMVAIDVATGDILWETELDAANFGAATVINDLVMTTTFDGIIYFLDREDGRIVHTLQAPAGINAWPAVAGDTIVLAAGVGPDPVLGALRLGAEEELPTAMPQQRTGTPAAERTGTAAPGALGVPPSEGTPDRTGTSTAEVTETLTVTRTVTDGATATAQAGAEGAVAPSGTRTAEVQIIEVIARSYEFEPSRIEVPAGEPVRFVVESPDIYHTFTVKRNQEATENLINLDVLPDEPPAEVTYTFEEPGEYYLYCIPHEGLGMTGTIVVQ